MPANLSPPMSGPLLNYCLPTPCRPLQARGSQLPLQGALDVAAGAGVGHHPRTSAKDLVAMFGANPATGVSNPLCIVSPCSVRRSQPCTP
jgi:hypothetical protein